ncbi:MAG: helix-turn-helix domain-containing protein [Victivallales bacterium]|nr:helix-turn-helix domain-containing protein [Victivallales bacterium]
MEAEALRQLGFGERKATLYLTLLTMGRGTAAELAAAAKIKRTTAYDLLAELTADHLAAVTFVGNKRYFVAEPPEQLQTLAARRVQAADRLMPGLKELFYRHADRPRVRYFEGAEGIRRVHEELLKVKNREYFYFGSISGFVDALGRDYLERFVRRRISRRIWSYAIRIRSQEIDSPLLLPGNENYRRVRYLSRSLPDNVASLTFYDGKIAICSTSHENYAMIVESWEMYTILKLVWDCMWDVATA